MNVLTLLCFVVGLACFAPSVYRLYQRVPWRTEWRYWAWKLFDRKPDSHMFQVYCDLRASGCKPVFHPMIPKKKK